MERSELVRNARDGDRDAYDILVTESIDAMYRVARLVLRDYDSAADAVQEALVRCWRDLPRLREPDRFDAWLNRILLRAITEEFRNRNRRRNRLVVTLLPLAFVSVITLTAGVLSVRDNFWPMAIGPNASLNFQGYLNTALTVIMMTCVVVILANALWKWMQVLSGRQATVETTA